MRERGDDHVGGLVNGWAVKQRGGVDEEVLVISSTTWMMVVKVFRGPRMSASERWSVHYCFGREGRRYLECSFFQHLMDSSNLHKHMRRSWYL